MFADDKRITKHEYQRDNLLLCFSLVFANSGSIDKIEIIRR